MTQDVHHGPASEVTPNGHNRETWLTARLRGGVGVEFREAAEAILRYCRLSDRPSAVEALHGMVDELMRWKDAYASAVYKTGRKPLAPHTEPCCNKHATEIAKLRVRVEDLERSAEKAERGRLALIAGLERVDQVTDAYALNRMLGRDEGDLVVKLREVSTQTHLRHRRVWR